jgi:single-stranded DNA-specific DHH superfamily exonuclease
MLAQKDKKTIITLLENSKKPFFFFHDDPDGLGAYLLLYKHIGRGKGHIIKNVPRITTEYLRKIEEYGPDLIIVLDIASIEQAFIDQAGLPLLWIDHHDVQTNKNVHYFNPKKEKTSTTEICYDVIKKNLWLATLGAVSDWTVPEFIHEFKKQYPDLLPKKITPEEMLFNSKLGKLIRIISFNLKGQTKDIFQAIRILSKIESPYEILNQESPKGRYLYKRYALVNKKHEEIKKRVIKKVTNDKFIVFTYSASKLSMTKDVANELAYLYPNKIIILGRIKSGEVRCSLRGSKYDIANMLEKALQDVQGHGGGHKHACGAGIKEGDFAKFVKNMRKQV